MPDCDYAWRRYEELQKHAMVSLHVNNYSWGVESALNYLLKTIQAGTVEADPAMLDEAIRRIICSAARLQRSRAQTLKKWEMPLKSISTSGLAEANMEIKRIDRSLSDRDKEIVLDAAYGCTDREIAGRIGSTPGAIRVRLSRLRERLAA